MWDRSRLARGTAAVSAPWAALSRRRWSRLPRVPGRPTRLRRPASPKMAVLILWPPEALGARRAHDHLPAVGDLTYEAELLEQGRVPGVGDKGRLRATTE